MDVTKELKVNVDQWYQGIIGTLRWEVEIVRIDILLGVSLVSTLGTTKRKTSKEIPPHFWVPQDGEVHILEVDPGKRTPTLVGIGTFAIPLSAYVLINLHINGYQ